MSLSSKSAGMLPASLGGSGGIQFQSSPFFRPLAGSRGSCQLWVVDRFILAKSCKAARGQPRLRPCKIPPAPLHSFFICTAIDASSRTANAQWSDQTSGGCARFTQHDSRASSGFTARSTHHLTHENADQDPKAFTVPMTSLSARAILPTNVICLALNT